MKEESFKILLEKSKKYRDGELYVMLINNDGAFMVEVANRKECLTRITLATRKEAEFLFSAIEDLFCRYRIVENAETTLIKAFDLKHYDLIVFAVYSTNRIMTNDNLVFLRKNIFIRFRTELNTEYLQAKKDMVTIFVSKDFKTKEIGYLVGNSWLNNLKFRFL